MSLSLSDGLRSSAICQRRCSYRRTVRRMVPIWWEACVLFMQAIGMSDATPSVSVIDDDREFRDSIARLLRTIGLETHQYSSVSDFLKADPAEGPTCLVLD